jgi:hypothetical protein
MDMAVSQHTVISELSVILDACVPFLHVCIYRVSV